MMKNRLVYNVFARVRPCVRACVHGGCKCMQVAILKDPARNDRKLVPSEND